MEIGIIGAGYIGGTLARKLAAAGHHVRIANSRSPETLDEFADEDGITPMWAVGAIEGVDVAIISVPQRSITNLPEGVLSVLRVSPIVIDTGNYYPVRDGEIAGIEQGKTDSEWVASHLGRPVFKVFNNIAAPSLKHKGKSHGGQRLGLTVAGPDIDDKNRVFDLVNQIGFDPVDAGRLEQSWRVQPGTPTYCKDMTADQLRAGLAETRPEDIPSYHAFRDQLRDFDAAMENLRARM
jgi:8-hydroxy-5-deazaflavin:NADPH oxidoreductase